METRTKFTALVLAMALIAGCSKNVEEPPIEAAAPVTSAPEVKSGIADISKQVESQQYDAAVGSLVMVRGLQMSPEDQAAYNQQLQKTIDALAQRAAQGDVKAQQSQQMLGRMVTGR